MRAGRDWQAERLRYLVHVSDSGSGVRYRDTQLDEGDELRTACTVCRDVRRATPCTPGMIER